MFPKAANVTIFRNHVKKYSCKHRKLLNHSYIIAELRGKSISECFGCQCLPCKFGIIAFQIMPTYAINYLCTLNSKYIS